jgi:hypothetical protein
MRQQGNAMQTNSVQDKPRDESQSPIAYASSGLTSKLSELKEIVVALRNRLEPVRDIKPSGDCNENPPQCLRWNVAHSFATAAAEVESIRNEISELIDELQV